MIQRSPALTADVAVVFGIVAVAVALFVTEAIPTDTTALAVLVSLAVTLAASTAFMTPMGYQTNPMVYSPGGYRFTDYVRVGAPLQLLLAVVTTLGIAVIWGA